MSSKLKTWRDINGIRVTRDRKSGTISIDQANYIQDILSRFNTSYCSVLATPMEATQQLTKKTCPSIKLNGALEFYVQVSSRIFVSM